ncbi:hypothetical protein MLD38_028873 [Melastoma candidum]|uniref:Uncharacterized protein n=1 Tax=Melastoma candidum TaxID=119954 RepID=A0ACB9N1Z0_9MYRT|nr:hypothetical protein MLD38_028873 [Melastoma candidum]
MPYSCLIFAWPGDHNPSLTIKFLRCVAVGNEPFLSSYSGLFNDVTLPVLQNIQNELNVAGLGDKDKATTTPFNAEMYNSPVSNPSPWLGLYKCVRCQFQHPVSALKAAGHRFYNGDLPKLAANVGTPPRPGNIEAYFFSLIDEDVKSIDPGNFERTSSSGDVKYLPDQWCVFNLNAKDLTKLGDSVDYTCSQSDHGSWLRILMQWPEHKRQCVLFVPHVLPGSEPQSPELQFQIASSSSSFPSLVAYFILVVILLALCT